MHIVRETFPSFDTMLREFQRRPNNKAMSGFNESKDSNYNFTGTESYGEAVSLLKNGYTAVLPRIKKSVEQNQKKYAKLYYVPRSTPQNHIAGFAPNVPRALLGLPDNMINQVKEPRKTRAISIIYGLSTPWYNGIDYFIDAGVALVSAINILELGGVQTKLTVAFKVVVDDLYVPTETLLSDVCIKDFGQRFSLQKICFPLVHPSMLRRFGFKELETCPHITSTDFRDGYGAPLRTGEEIRQYYDLPKDSFILTVNDINKDFNNDPSKIIDWLGVI